MLPRFHTQDLAKSRANILLFCLQIQSERAMERKAKKKARIEDIFAKGGEGGGGDTGASGDKDGSGDKSIG